MHLGKIAGRIRAILTSPRRAWPVIADEPDTAGGVFRRYVCIVAALPVIAGFIKHSLISNHGFGVHAHTALLIGLMSAIASYLLSLLATWVVALIVDALAPSFGARNDPVQALKTVAYAWTAGWVAGVAILIPWVGWLVWLAGGIYSVYLLYLGVQFVMQCPPDRAAGYTAVSVIIASVLSWLALFMVGAIIGTAALTGAALTGTHVHGDNGTAVKVDPDSALGRISALNGNAVAVSLSPEALRDLLPDELDGMKRSDFHAERSGASGMQVSTASATYSDGKDRNVQVELTDTGNGRGMTASTMAPNSEQHSDHGYEKTSIDHGHLVHERWDAQARTGEYSVVLAQRLSIKASGHATSIDELKQVVHDVGLDKLASLTTQDSGAR